MHTNFQKIAELCALFWKLWFHKLKDAAAGGVHFFRMSHMLCFPGVAAFSGYGSSQRLIWVGGHRADTWELQAGACNHLALAKANRTELLLAEPLALALCAWLKLRPTYLHVWEKEKKHAVSGWQLRNRNEVEGEYLTLTYPSVGLGTFPLLFIKFPFIYTCVVCCCCLFLKTQNLKWKWHWKQRSVREKTHSLASIWVYF